VSTIVYPGLSSTVIPLFELSGNLMVAYGRNEKDIRVNNYTRTTGVKSTVGNYLRFNPKDLARLPNLPQKPHWAPGTPSPTGFHETLGYEVIPFRTSREAFAKTLDKRSVDIASFPVMKTHTAALGQQAMTYVAYRCSTALTTTANFNASHVFTATTASGTGVLTGGTTADPRIKNAFNYAARIIQGDTFGAVKYGQLSVLMNHVTAQKLSSSREIREYVMQHNEAYKAIRLDQDKNYNALYDLPDRLYGFKVVVEDSYYNSGNRGNASEGPSVVFPDNTITVFLADGDLEQPEGASSFSTCHRFAYEEFTLETKDDTWNRLVEMRAVLDFDVQIVAPPTGCIITNVIS
jgi:hypothetical protein